MAKKISKSAQNGTVKKSTDVMIDNSIARQNSWMARRREFAKRFFKKLNIFARKEKTVKKETVKPETKKSGITSYWFPILCAVLVIFITVWVVFIRSVKPEQIIIVPNVPEPIVMPITEETAEPEDPEQVKVPTFDVVRIEPSGNIIVAGRYFPNKTISIVMNKTIVSTQTTDENGEFVYAPKRSLKSGNYTIQLISADSKTTSVDKVFIYVSPHGYQNSVSLLMTKNGSTLLQSPKLVDGDLVVSKIDYLASGRIVVTGDSLPRLRVSLTLNDKYLGYAHVSDHKHFGLGADIEKLQPGKKYELVIRLHDGDGTTVSQVVHEFVMPKITGAEDTFYTVRQDDCLWIISRNFLGRGVLFSIIAQANNIKNPNMIFPKQVLKIPVKVK